jgi:hypothetical protein
MEQQANEAKPATTKHCGSCHCGTVRYEVETDLSNPGSRCNCSVCTKTSVTSGIVKPDKFTLLTPEAELGSYAWGAKTSTRFFCKNCGVQCFGRGYLVEVGGDYVAVNLNTLDEVELTTLSLIHWDGRHNNWQGGPRPMPWPMLAPDNSAS